MSRVKNFFSFQSIAESQEQNLPSHASIPSLWENFGSGDFKLDNLVRKKLLKIGQSFFEAISPIIGDVKLADFRISGQCANPKNRKFSDIDLDILIDFNSSDNERINQIKTEVEKVKSDWILENCPKCRGYFVDPNVVDTRKYQFENYYSLKFEKLNFLAKNEDESKDFFFERKFFNISSLIENMENKFFLKSLPDTKKDMILERAHSTKKRIQGMRRIGVDQAKNSAENMTFQKLKKEGYINKLVKILNSHK